MTRSSATIDIDLIPLTLLRPGQRARVLQIVGFNELVHRLHEMGLRAGVEVEMIGVGSPCLVRLNGLKLGLRAEELSGVLVRVGAGTMD